MTEQTIAVEAEQTVAVCDVCGKGEDAYDDRLVTFAPQGRTFGNLHFHERCLVDVEGIAMPHEGYGSFQFGTQNQFHTDDIRGVFVAADARRVVLAMVLSIVGTGIFAAALETAIGPSAAMPAGTLAVLSLLFLGAAYIRAVNLARRVRRGLK